MESVRDSARGGRLLADPLIVLLERMRRGELSPVELVDEHIRRVQAVNPRLNCVVAERFDSARREAQEAEREYAVSRTPRPLLGIPFTVKEMIEVSGMPLTFGSIGRRHRHASGDATVVARLRAAGAIPLGVTNVPEWGMWSESYNRIYGRTSNPYDTRHTPGGSSGGEGASVGSGASVFGVGSDIGGSVRIPAAFCGVFGHKPTTGMLPLTGHYPVYAGGPDSALVRTAPYVSIGTLTRSAQDIAPLMRTMSGRDGIDPNAEPLAFHNPDGVEWHGRRVLLLARPVITRASRPVAEISAGVERAGRLLEARGADVHYAPDRLFQHTADIWFAALQTIGGPSFSEMLAGNRRVWLEFEVLRTLFGFGRYSWPALFFCIGERIGRKKEKQVRAALRETRRLSRRYRELLDPEGVLVMPVHPRTAPRHNGAILHPFDFLYTAPLNVLRAPSTTAPMGLDAQGLPLAVQIASVRGNDHLTIAAASVMEQSLGAWKPAPVL